MFQVEVNGGGKVQHGVSLALEFPKEVRPRPGVKEVRGERVMEGEGEGVGQIKRVVE